MNTHLQLGLAEVANVREWASHELDERISSYLKVRAAQEQGFRPELYDARYREIVEQLLRSAEALLWKINLAIARREQRLDRVFKPRRRRSPAQRRAEKQQPSMEA